MLPDAPPWIRAPSGNPDGRHDRNSPGSADHMITV
jgi:hypothetical protein